MARCPFGITATRSQEHLVTRRVFLKESLLGAALAALALGAPPLVACAAADFPWRDAPFTGDLWEQCHDLRDSKTFPRGESAEDVDVLVVGGGVSGLIAGWHLMRHHKVVVLEKDPQAGGNSRSGTWEGVKFPLGALYFAKPSASIHRFLTDIGLPPTQIPGSADTLLTRGRYVTHFMGDGIADLPLPADVRRAFKTAWRHFTAFNRADEVPEVPLNGSSTKARALDTVTFLQYCKDNKIHEQVTKFLDQYVRSCWGVGSEKVSAFAAINFLASEFEPLYSFPGGNGAISYALGNLLGERIRTGCFVHDITQEKGAARVDYVVGGKPAAIRARQVIVAIPKHIARRVLSGPPAVLAEALGSARYGAYLVGAVFLHEPLADKGFDVWVEDRWYSDLSVADWMATHGSPPAHRRTVMVAYIPMGEQDGRAALLTTPHHDFAERLLSEMEKDFPQCRRNVAGIQFARYGHPMVIPYPGYITNVTPSFYKPFGRVWFANCDSHGLACMESAFSAAMMAANGVEASLRSYCPSL